MQHLGFTRVGDPKGKPLAIVHGWGCDSSFLLPIANMFRERDIYLIDLPGYGESMHLAPFAQDLVSTTFMLINTLPDGADLFSWSFGTLYVLRALSLISDPTFKNHDISAHYFDFQHHVPLCPGLNQPRLSSINFSQVQKPTSAYQSFAQESLQENLMIAQAMHRALHSSMQTRNRLLAEIMDDIDENEATTPLKHRPLSADHPTTADTSSSTPDLNHAHEQEYFYKLFSKIKLPSIHSLVTICGSPRFPADPNWPGINPVRILKLNTELNSRRLRTVLNLFYHMQFSVSTPQLDKILRRCLSMHPPISDAVLMSGIQQVSYMDERPALEHLRIPSFHMFGARDRLVPCKIAQFCPHDALHSSYIFPYSSHNPFLTEPEEFERQIRLFFERIKNYEAQNF